MFSHTYITCQKMAGQLQFESSSPL